MPTEASGQRNWLAEPLVHFVALGAVLALAHGALTARPSSPPIEVGPELLAALAAEHAARHGAAPTDDELEAARRRWVRDEALYREALALGLDRDDAIVRRRLIQKMELVLAAGAPAPAIDDAERGAYLEAHRAELMVHERRTIDGRYFDRERADALADARVAREALVRGEVVSSDPLLAATGWDRVSRAELARSLGAAPADALFALEPGLWSEPIVLATGVLLARATDVEPASMPELAAVSARIDAAIAAERSTDALDAAIDEVVARHTEDGAR